MKAHASTKLVTRLENENNEKTMKQFLKSNYPTIASIDLKLSDQKV